MVDVVSASRDLVDSDGSGAFRERVPSDGRDLTEIGELIVRQHIRWREHGIEQKQLVDV